MKKLIDSLDLKELSEREEFVAVPTEGEQTTDEHGPGLWIVGWKVG